MLRRRRRGVRIVEQTPSYGQSTPRVTVMLVVRPDHEQGAVESLASAAASLYDAFEVLVLDVSGERPTPALRGLLDDHRSLPIRLLRRPEDRGLAHSRNTLAKQARGEYMLFLDPGSGIYPSTLERLVKALDADPDAALSYPMVAAYNDGNRPVELLSSLPWEPDRFRQGNWIDGIALIRRSRLLELGGYSTDPRLAGWEDFYLWCRCADAGAHGVHVPQVLGWRRHLSSPETPAKWALMRELFPALLSTPSNA